MRRLFTILVTTISLLSLWAQDGIIYSCDFEDATERAQWVLNPTANPQQKANLTNFWNIGAAGQFAPTGNNGLFIGTSEGTTVSAYNASKSVENTAYRVLPEMEAGNYTITFNWLANCKGGQEGLYACLVPVSTNTYSGATALTMPWFKTSVIPMTIDTVMQGTSTWSVATANFSLSAKAQYKLVFMFFAVKGAVVGPAPAVDNICIFEAGHCAAPTNVTHTIDGMDVELKWKGEADSYDVRTYSYETGKWQETNVPATSAKTQSTLISNVEEGIGIFFLRSHCGDYASEWVKYEKFIFHKGTRCIDYMDLNKSNCAYGSTSDPDAAHGVVDYGYADKYSRHTLHYVINEIDPRTVTADGKYVLKTKPDDALASVRLGNWDIGAQAEQISYNYKVTDVAYAVMQLRYAVVIQDPAHDAAAQPRFTLSILHNGKKLPGNCGEANFAAEGQLTPEDGWHEAGEGTNKLFWKEWTTVSVNLQDYIGETIKIILTTYDCTQSGHFGYAYFTLDCSGGEMSGLNCGEDNPTTLFTAPEGFDYKWYLPETPATILSEEQTFTIDPMDTLTYYVDVMNKTNHECYYTLTACGWPRIPVPVIKSVDVVAERCENVVTIEQDSYVKLKNQITKQYYRSNEKITSLYWDFGDGSEVVQCLDSAVKHTYPGTGGQFVLKLKAGVSGDACLETLEHTLDLPDLAIPRTTEKAHACREDYPFGYRYGDKWWTTDTVADVIFIAQNGCDSVVEFTLQWSDTMPHPDEKTICEGDTFRMGGQELTEEGVYNVYIKDSYGCDSLVELTLHTTPMLVVETGDTFIVCADDRVLEIPYEVLGGAIDQIFVRFDKRSQTKGMLSEYSFSEGDEVMIAIPDSIEPTILNAELNFTPNRCSLSDKPIRIELRYMEGILKQKKGMLAVMNERYNGNMTFDSFQWYRDDIKIEGATRSLISVSDADLGHEFSVEMVRKGDSELMPVRTCVIIYKVNVGGQQQAVADAAPYTVYMPDGHVVGVWSSLESISGLPFGIYFVKDAQNNVYKICY